jgi:hypothetical protein
MSKKVQPYDNETFNYVNYIIKDNGAKSKSNNFATNNRSPDEMKKIANDLLNEMKTKNNDPQFKDHVSCDTFAVGVVNNDKIVITANLKERREVKFDEKSKQPIGPSMKIEKMRDGVKEPGSERVNYKEFGVHERIVKDVVEIVKKSEAYRKSDLELVIVEEKFTPTGDMAQKVELHAENHAEMKMKAYAKENGENIEIIGMNYEFLELVELYSG